jgi:hypothetical protein
MRLRHDRSSFGRIIGRIATLCIACGVGFVQSGGHFVWIDRVCLEAGHTVVPPRVYRGTCLLAVIEAYIGHCVLIISTCSDAVVLMAWGHVCLPWAGMYVCMHPTELLAMHILKKRKETETMQKRHHVLCGIGECLVISRRSNLPMRGCGCPRTRGRP